MPPEDTLSIADALAAELLAQPAEGRAAWLAARQNQLTLDVIAVLKQYSSDQQACADPIAADDATRCALLVAQYCAHEPLALPLAYWARGNWEAFHNPQAAIDSYQRAIEGYRAADDTLSVARLLSNLVFTYSDCGRFPEARMAYAEARELLLRFEGDRQAQFYLLPLEQNYGWLLHNQGQYEDALLVHTRALDLAYLFDRLDMVAEIQVNRTLTLGMLGQLTEGEAALLHDREIAQRHGQVLTVARIDMNLGEFYTALGRPAEALRRFNIAREGFAALNNSMEVGTVLLREAVLFERVGALGAARRNYIEAQQRFAAHDMRPYVGVTLVRRAAVERLAGKYGQASRLLEEAEALWHLLEHPLWLATVTLEHAALALARADTPTALALLQQSLPVGSTIELEMQHDALIGDFQALHWSLDGDQVYRDEARRAYERVLTSAQEHSDRWMQRRALSGLGHLALTQDSGAAQCYLEAAAAQDDIIRQSLSVEELKASFHRHTGDVLPTLVRMSVEQGQPIPALQYTWRAKGSALLEVLKAAQGERLWSEDDEVEIARVRQQLAIQRWRIALEAQPNEPESLHERSDPVTNALEQQLYDLRRRSNTAGNATGALDDPLGVLKDIPADVLIEYICCGEDLLAIRADRSGSCAAFWLVDAPAILDLLDRIHLSFHNFLMQSDERRQHYLAGWLEECRPLLQDCYEMLIAPLGVFPVGARLCIAPCDPLYLLPFAALWDGQRYLIEQHEIQLLPSGALFTFHPPTEPTTTPFVIAASSEGRLSAVAAEAAAVAEALPSSICLVDDGGAIASLRALPAAPEILHIAAHSVLREDAPIFSALRLAGELLSIEQCYNLPLRGTRLVTLSGCTTSTGLDTGGSLLAFQTAFLAAGAHAVMSSLWPVDDRSTAEWMSVFYTALAAGLDPVAALRQTQCTLLANGNFYHPALWAAFTISCCS